MQQIGERVQVEKSTLGKLVNPRNS